MCLAQLTATPAPEPKLLDPAIQKIAEFLASHPHRITGTTMFLGINQPSSCRPALKAEQMYK
jgi:hypothetical protein